MLSQTFSKVIAHSSSFSRNYLRSITEASPSSKKGTVTAITGAINNFSFITEGQGSVALPPMIARVSMAAAGASAVKNELWTTFEDFLRP